jgi:hypothetical protein
MYILQGIRQRTFFIFSVVKYKYKSKDNRRSHFFFFILRDTARPQ